VQDNAVIHVGDNGQTLIGDDVTIGHCAFMEDCVIEEGALIGTNAVILNGATVGRRALIGAGSVVGANVKIPPETVAAGAPAQVKKKLEGVAVSWVDHAGPEYVHLSRSYLHHGIGDPEVHELVEAKPV
jgi:carbonic anhydrase/acetyltransferase-like protein (isoleucine patch superfamily)